MRRRPLAALAAVLALQAARCRSQDKISESGFDEHNNCYISFSECAAHPAMQSGADGWFAMRNLAVDEGAEFCLPRAVDYFHHCQVLPVQNALRVPEHAAAVARSRSRLTCPLGKRGEKNRPDSPVVATFIPTGESLEYPPPGGAQNPADSPEAESSMGCRVLNEVPRWPPPAACPEREGSWGERAAGGKEQRVAIVVAGQLFRFAWQTLYEGIVEPNIAAGHTVHVFVYLSRDDMGGMHNHYHWSRARRDEGAGGGGGGEAARRQRPGAGDRSWKHEAVGVGQDAARELALKRAVQLSLLRGAVLKGWAVGNHWAIDESFGDFRFSQWQGRDRAARVQQYVGWYRAWLLVQDAEVAAREHYDTIVLQRADAFWLSPAAPAHWFPSRAISYKACPSQNYGGVYDKVFVVPRALAHVWLEAVVYLYLDTAVTASFYNNEHYLGRHSCRTLQHA